MGVAVLDIEDIVKSDPHVKKIVPTEGWPIPDVDYSKFSADSADFAKVMINSIIRFLSSKYIIDDFKNPDERRAWRIVMDRKYAGVFWDFYEHNGLKAKMFAQLTAKYTSIADVLEDCYMGENKEKLNFLNQLLKNDSLHQSSYDSMSPLEKISYVKKLKQKAFLFLSFFSKKRQI